MSRIYYHGQLRRSVWFFVLAIAGGLSLGDEKAMAVVPTPTGFTLNMSPYANVLDAIGTPDFMQVLKEQSCDNPILRTRARNKPAVMITNDAASVAPITSMTLGIDVSQPYKFGMGDVPADAFVGFIKDTIFTDSGVTITGSSVSPNGKTLTVNFNGLTAGKKAIFNIDLDANDMNMFPFPDYRMVLLGAPQPGQQPTPPGTFSATFVDSGSPAPNSRTLSGMFEQMTVTPQYHDLVVRPYHAMDMLEVITTGGQIPEPSGLILALGGLGFFAGQRLWRRSA